MTIEVHSHHKFRVTCEGLVHFLAKTIRFERNASKSYNTHQTGRRAGFSQYISWICKMRSSSSPNSDAVILRSEASRMALVLIAVNLEFRLV